MARPGGLRTSGLRRSGRAGPGGRVGQGLGVSGSHRPEPLERQAARRGGEDDMAPTPRARRTVASWRLRIGTDCAVRVNQPSDLMTRWSVTV